MDLLRIGEGVNHRVCLKGILIKGRLFVLDWGLHRKSFLRMGNPYPRSMSILAGSEANHLVFDPAREATGGCPPNERAMSDLRCTLLLFPPWPKLNGQNAGLKAEGPSTVSGWSLDSGDWSRQAN